MSKWFTEFEIVCIVHLANILRNQIKNNQIIIVAGKILVENQNVFIVDHFDQICLRKK